MRREMPAAALTRPPVAEAPKEHLAGAHPADAVARAVEGHIWARGYVRDVREEVELDERLELAWLSLQIFHDLCVGSEYCVVPVKGGVRGQKMRHACRFDMIEMAKQRNRLPEGREEDSQDVHLDR
jgi:hypothetical protein